MGPIELNKRRIFLLVAAVHVFFVLLHLHGFSSPTTRYPDILPGVNVPSAARPPYPKPQFHDDDRAWDYPKVEPVAVPAPPAPPAPAAPAAPALPPLSWSSSSSPPVANTKPAPEDFLQPAASPSAAVDLHPINRLMEEADHAFRVYEEGISTTFRQTVDKYRSKYGRHPPPNFGEWYKFARMRGVFNIDDFDHIMDDLRPFWAIDPATIRAQAAHLWGDDSSRHHAAGIHIRDHQVAKVSEGMWRSEVMEEVINTFVSHLPDMDIAMNKQDQPRVVVPWEAMQGLLRKEQDTRALPPSVTDSFTANQTNLLNVTDNSTTFDPGFEAGWFDAPGQHYMKIASKACPPSSPARHMTILSQKVDADVLYKEDLGGFVNNFNLSTDLCTVGPALDTKHGMLFAASSLTATHQLVPIFSECKTSVNSDILFPANMYYKHDARYDYDPSDDVDWRQKADNITWRGVTSGGVQTADNWKTMHRQRLVQLFNGTQLSADRTKVAVLSQANDQKSHDSSKAAQAGITYTKYDHFLPARFAEEHSDIGFVEAWGCDPDCSFYNNIFSMKNQTTLSSQFRSRYLIDVDGHSFSGRWHAFLQSKSLGFKATIFREWHDSRLFAWKHFIPVDNRYDDLYALLTYFVGYGQASADRNDPNPNVYIARHEKEAQQIARQSREWANTVLRREDIEVYMFRLLLEYGRIIDDNRDRIGYSGDGSELDAFDNGQTAKSAWNFMAWLQSKDKGKTTGKKITGKTTGYP